MLIILKAKWKPTIQALHSPFYTSQNNAFCTGRRRKARDHQGHQLAMCFHSRKRISLLAMGLAGYPVSLYLPHTETLGDFLTLAIPCMLYQSILLAHWNCSSCCKCKCICSFLICTMIYVTKLCVRTGIL